MNFTRQTSPHGSLVALSTMKDEGPFVVEWVAHHLALGFTEVMVYTNDCSDGTDALLKRLEALDIGVHHRENVIPEGMKPHPSMLLKCLDDAGVTAEHAVIIGDTVFDIAMGVNAGVKAIGVDWGYHEAEELREAGAIDVAADALHLKALLHG